MKRDFIVNIFLHRFFSKGIFIYMQLVLILFHKFLKNLFLLSIYVQRQSLTYQISAKKDIEAEASLIQIELLLVRESCAR